ncbi:PAC2 family protein [Litorihabitans aurantiacus]|uniref:PAC2 family protein n=1 Tax=Litorihabitans aurantiacus TaxID=1930061 RepID=A0AA37UM72_9MICO|nr:PAC2 family protein [Litorihabitans aurantiacus]GMA31105.1 hypothetical protein GCM10025875_10970 [Litorihabitans aurantiacus]
MTDSQPTLVLAAFEGWNDAGSAASEAIAQIATAWGATEIAALDPEDFYDFQVNRPVVGPPVGRGGDEDGDGDAGPGTDGSDRSDRPDSPEDGPRTRELTWPATTVSVTTSPVTGRTVLLVQGIEPSMRWRQYCREILAVVGERGPATFVGVGALLADVPHTRPIPVQSTSDDPVLQAMLGIDASEYSGPAGIISVLGHAAREEGMRTLSVWAAVPHYVAQPPSPKATLALLAALEEVVGEPLPMGELLEDARAWQRGVDELAEEDPEISEYVRQLEEAKDTADLPEASGEAIAREFEQYLRRRDPGHGRDGGPAR